MEYKYSSDELQDDSDNRSFITIHDSCDSLYDSHGNSIVTSDDGYDSQASTVILSDNDEILDVMLSPEEMTELMQLVPGVDNIFENNNYLEDVSDDDNEQDDTSDDNSEQEDTNDNSNEQDDTSDGIEDEDYDGDNENEDVNLDFDINDDFMVLEIDPN